MSFHLFRFEDGDVGAVSLDDFGVIEVSSLRQNVINGAPDVSLFKKLTRDDILVRINSLGGDISSRATKGNIVSEFRDKWQTLIDNANRAHPQPPSDGFEDLKTHASRADNPKCFRVYFEGDQLFVSSFRGAYLVATGTDEIMEFLQSNNCLIIQDEEDEEQGSGSEAKSKEDEKGSGSDVGAEDTVDIKDVSGEEPQPLTEGEATTLAILEKTNIPNRGFQVNPDIMWKLQEKRDAYEAFKNVEQESDDHIYFPNFEIDADKEAQHPDLFQEKEGKVLIKVLCGDDKVIQLLFVPSAKIQTVVDEIADLTDIPKDGFRLIHPNTKMPYDLDFALLDCSNFDPVDGLTVRVELRLKGGGVAGVKKTQFAKKEDAMKGLKKKLCSMRQPDDELNHSFDEMPVSFKECVDGFDNQLTTFLALKATAGSSFISLCLKHVDLENLKGLEKIYAKGTKGTKHLTSEEKAMRTVEMIYPALNVMTKVSEKMDYVKMTHMSRLLEVYAEEYGVFNEQSHTISLNSDAFALKLKAEIDRRQEGAGSGMNTEAIQTTCVCQ
eukprot:s685_g14.t1